MNACLNFYTTCFIKTVQKKKEKNLLAQRLIWKLLYNMVGKGWEKVYTE